MRAIRDAESRTRFLGYPRRVVQALDLRVLGGHRRHRRRALRAAGRHHQSERVRADQLDRSRHLGGRRRARHALRRGGRRGAGQLRQDVLHRRAAGGLALRARRAVRPGHAVPAARDWSACGRRRWCIASRARSASAQRASTVARHGTILYLERLTVSFDGFKALNELTLYVEPGELRCIIGPNGAGKTTMMDVITGKTRPDAGSAWFGTHASIC